MTELILDALKANNIDTYLIEDNKEEIAELFFIKKNLDMRRTENTHTSYVTVYRDFEKDGEKFRGDAAFTVEAATTREELDAKIKRAYTAAQFVPNPFYEIAPEVKQDCFTMESTLAGLTLEDVMKKYVEALYAADCDDKAFINTAESFVKKLTKHIINSNGVDVSYIKYSVEGEFVAQCKEPQDVETYQSFKFEGLDTEELTSQAREALKLTRDRAVADTAPKAGQYDVVLSGEYAATVMSYYRDRANGAYIYRQYSDYKTGDFIQGEKSEITGDIINADYLPSTPFSNEGVPMKKLPCIGEGVFQNIHSGCRYSYYLGIKPIGAYTKLEITPGTMSFEDMKKHKGLYVVNFSDFQMDSMGGNFGGEIRLAYLNDGEKITPVTGGSINGSIIEAQKSFRFSSETQNTSKFVGPKAILLKNVSVAGL